MKSLEEIPLLTAAEIEAIRNTQAQELIAVEDSTLKDHLRMRHKIDLEFLTSRKLTITIEHLLQYPFERKFDTRLEMTEWQKKLDGNLGNFRRALEEKNE